MLRLRFRLRLGLDLNVQQTHICTQLEKPFWLKPFWFKPFLVEHGVDFSRCEVLVAAHPWTTSKVCDLAGSRDISTERIVGDLSCQPSRCERKWSRIREHESGSFGPGSGKTSIRRNKVWSNEARLAALIAESEGLREEIPPTLPATTFVQELAELRACVSQQRQENSDLRCELQNRSHSTLDLAPLNQTGQSCQSQPILNTGRADASTRMETLIETADASLRSNRFNPLAC